MNVVVRLGVVDDHEAIRVGLAAAAWADAKTAAVPVKVVRLSETVDHLLAGGEKMFDVVALDMSLADGSRPGGNVQRILDAGYPVLVFTIGDKVDDLREALAAGAAGVSRKSEPMGHTLDLVRKVAAGEITDNQDLAAAIGGDSRFVARLSEREQETLALYAAGHPRRLVAARMNVSESTVATNLKRIRKKYAAADRQVSSRIDLHRRAVEDGILHTEQE